MRKICGVLLIVFVVFGVTGQDVALPTDFRQQNLTIHNANLLNPAYALEGDEISSLALWSRWQWQVYDADPTSLFLNYTRKLSGESAIGAGFYQHNTGFFLNTGGVINYAHAINIGPNANLGFGINIFGYNQKLADNRFFIPNPIQTEPANDFVLQLAPGINLNIGNFNIGVTSENLYDYNFSTSSRNSDPGDRIFFGAASYDFVLAKSGSYSKTFLRPGIYFKSIPNYDTQIGVNGLLSTDKYWAQLGYNSFYGISAGLGGRFFKQFSFGALVEYGINNELEGKDPSFELVTAYSFGKPPKEDPEEKQEELIAETGEEKKTRAERIAERKEAKEKQELAVLAQQKQRDSIREAKSLAIIAEREATHLKEKERIEALEKEKEKAILEAREKRLQKQQDSIKAVKEAIALNEQKKKVTPRAGERYEEVNKEGDLKPGFYLIANVFGTKRYFDAFMADLQKKGLDPGSFYRAKNKFNYVYLARFNTINEARAARDSKFNGTYKEKTWIFRVLGQ